MPNDRSTDRPDTTSAIDPNTQEGIGRKLDSEEFEKLAKGSSIQSVSQAGRELRIETNTDLVFTIEITPSSTFEFSLSEAPIRTKMVLLNDLEEPVAALIEQRVRCVRQLYALSFIASVPVLGDVEVVPIAALLLENDPNSDLEDLVPLKLEIRCAGTGTFWVDFFLILKKAPSDVVRKACVASLLAVSLLSRRGWELLSRLLEAKVGMAEADRKSREIATQAQASDADTKRRRESIELAASEFKNAFEAWENLEKLKHGKQPKEEHARTVQEINVLQHGLLANMKGLFGAQSKELLAYLPADPLEREGDHRTA